MTRRSPTARHRRLINELNRLRESSGLSRAQVAERIGSTDTTIWRYETGTTRPKVSDVSALLETYGVTGAAREELLEVAKDARKRGWWHRYRQTLKPGFDSYIGLEAEAGIVRTYQAQVVPGLLQTPDYTRAVIIATGEANQPSDVDEKVTVRRSRQQLITRSNEPLQLVAILDEAVIRRPVGSASIMESQLKHLIECNDLPNVTIRVLPFAVGAHAALDGPFYLLGFPEHQDPDVVYLEQAASGLVPEEPEEVRRYTLIFGNLLAKALSADESTAFIAAMAE